MNSDDMKPVWEWPDGSQVRLCRVLGKTEGKRSTMIVQFLARVNTSARGLDYYSWAINDHAVEMIRKAKNPRVFVALEVVRGERWEEEGRFFHRDKFLKLMKNFSRRPKGGNGDFATISEFELARFAANPENPERKMWDK